jgi:hypothetical protein
MPDRIFPKPFRMTEDSLKVLQDPESPPVRAIQAALLLSASFLIDLAFLPPSLAETVIKGK